MPELCLGGRRLRHKVANFVLDVCRIFRNSTWPVSWPFRSDPQIAMPPAPKHPPVAADEGQEDAAAASSKVPAAVAAWSQESLVNEDAMKVLRMSKGIVRVPLEELGPAVFNRHGEATSGQHCLKLGKRILTLEGFGTFRYVAGYCHEPDPADPLAVATHGNSMQVKDNLLPRLPAKPLKGVFAKTHLVTFLQMYKNGQMPQMAPQASSQSAPSLSREDLNDAIEHGVFMHVFPWSVVRDNRQAVEKLMAADNFDHGHGLADSEMRCIKAVRVAIAASSQGTLHVPAGLTQWDVVLRQALQLSGQRWREQDIGFFWDFAKSTLEGHFELMHAVWSYAECESVVKVEAAWFGAMSKLNPKLQWTRASLVVAHFLSDQEKECSVVAGQCVAGAIAKSVVKKIKERDAAPNQDWEDWLHAVMEKYWTAWSHDPQSRPVAREVGLPAVAAFLDRAGRFVANAATMAEVDEKKTRFEGKLRATLEPGWSGDMPEPTTNLSDEKKKTPWKDSLDAEPQLVADEKGRAVLSVKRQAQEKNLEVGASVSAKRQRKRNGQETIITATITAISDQGVTIKWGAAGDGSDQTDIVAVSAIDLITEKEEPAPSQEDMLIREAIKWCQVSSATNVEMLLQLTMATLYQAYVARSSAHEDLHVIYDGGVAKIYATRDMKVGSLVLLPFGDLVDESCGAGANAPVALEIGGEKGEKPARTGFMVRSKATPNKYLSQQKVVVLVPFWVLATKPATGKELQASKAASSQAASELQYKTTTLAVPAAPPLEKRGAKNKANIVIKTLCLTNPQAVVKGSRLYVAQKLPSKFE